MGPTFGAAFAPGSVFADWATKCSSPTLVTYRPKETPASAAPKASSRLLAIEGANHGFGAVHPYAGPTADLERVFDETAGWFSRHLPSPRRGLRRESIHAHLRLFLPGLRSRLRGAGPIGHEGAVSGLQRRAGGTDLVASGASGRCHEAGPRALFAHCNCSKRAVAAAVSASCLLEPSAVASPTFLIATRTVNRGA